VTDGVEQLILLAEQDPQACVATCQEIISQETANGRLADAHRALGIALRSLGEIEESIRQLEVARGEYQDGGDDEAASEATISLAASIAMSGRLGEGIDSLQSVLRHHNTSVRAHAQVQKAGLIARTGDLRGAMDLYARAQPILERLDDLRWLALLHSNRGMVQTLLSEYEAAEADFTLARDLFLDLDRSSSAAEMLHNLGFVAVQQGDIARGLALLLDAEAQFDDAGLPTEAIAADRAYAYMLAGLPGNAFSVASAAARALGAQARALERTEAMYLAARAALAGGDLGSAARAADEAAQLATEQNREAWRLMATVVKEEAGFRAGLPGDPRELVALADAFSEQGMPSGEMHAQALASLRFVEAGDLTAAEDSLSSMVANDSVRTDLPIQLLVTVANARLMLAKGDREKAAEVLEEGADLVDRHRILLSATEARAGVSLLADEIAELGLEAIHGDRPSVIGWTERFRGASLRIAPVVMTRDTEMADHLANLRGVVRELEELTLAGEDTTELASEAQRIERRIGDLSVAREQEAGAVSPTPAFEQVTDALGPRRMLYIYDVADRTYAEIAGPNGVERVKLGDAGRMRFLAHHLLSGFRREFMLRGRNLNHPSHVDEMVIELARYLLSPLVETGPDAVIVPPPDLVSLPWNAMAAAVDSGLSVVVAPSAGQWMRADRLTRRQDRVGVVAGPRLEYATAEAERVAGLYDEPEVLRVADSTVEAVIDTMGRCDRLHAVAHTRLRDDNPMFSALELADGFLNLYDLEGLESVPDTVVLSACDSAHDNVVGGNEMYGLTSLLLSRGARSIIATVAPIPDAPESVEAVARIHASLGSGSTSARAVHDAQAGFAGPGVDPSLAFVAYGA
jgi:tetratricopeptide (TPR) repeat protein